MSWPVEQAADNEFKAHNFVHLGVRPLFPRARLLPAVATGPKN
jgi:hypothetical protein